MNSNLKKTKGNNSNAYPSMCLKFEELRFHMQFHMRTSFRFNKTTRLRDKTDEIYFEKQGP